MPVINFLSKYSLIFIIMSVLIYAIFKKVNIFDEFIKGAEEGLKSTVKIIPVLVGLLVGIAVFKSSGAMNFLTMLLSAPAKLLGIPSSVLPLALLRPVSGGGSLAVVSDIFKEHGPDSFSGRLASVMMGSTETTVYTVAVYFGVTHVEDIRYAFKAGILADAICVLASVFVCRLMFG